jgi:hypothetical protein
MKNYANNDTEVIRDPALIREIAGDPIFDRDFDQPVFSRNPSSLQRMLWVFSVNGKRFPTMCPRTDAQRAAAQDELWARLNAIAQEIKSGPDELEPLAQWVRGTWAEDRIGPLVQQSVGRLFVSDFTSTEESWAAARMMLEASVSTDRMKMLWWRLTGKLERAKELLSTMVDGNLSAVNGIGVALHHIADGLRRMRQIAGETGTRGKWTPEAIADECLFAPGSVARLAKADGTVGGCPFQKGKLFVLSLASATQGRRNRDLVFLSESWSRCPADTWVPALLEGVWRRVQPNEGQRG